MANNALLITADIFYKNMLDYLFIFLSRDFNISVFCSSFEILGKNSYRKVMTLANPCKT